jgi:hypothetical protein
MKPKHETASLNPECDIDDDDVSRYMPWKRELAFVKEHEKTVHNKNHYIYAICVVRTHYLNSSIQMYTYKLNFLNSMK